MKCHATPAMLKQVVHIIDDDEAVLDSLSMLLNSVGIENAIYSNAQTFLNTHQEETIRTLAGCIVLDVRMPGMSGMECQQQLEQLKCSLPVIFVTGHGDVPMAVEAMKKGAIEFIQKPFREQELLDCIQHALEMNKAEHERASRLLDIDKRRETLTKRENEVMQRVIAGQANKVIACELNLSQRTIEIHRSNVMDKMQVNSLAELVTLALIKE